MTLLEEIARVQREAELLYSEAQVEAAITRVAGEITVRLAGRNPLILTVLNGGIIFAGKLVSQLPFPLQLDAINASRYRGATQGSQIHWLVKPAIPLKDRTILLVDEILDEGITLAEIITYCREQGAREVLTAVLVDKDLGRDKPSRADFVGLSVPNRYLFGYGMDYKSYLRNAPGIFACKDL